MALSLTRISLAFFSQATIVSSSTVNGVASGGAPTAMYRPNFSQAFQRAGPTTVPPTLSAGLYPTQSFTSGLLSNGTQSNIAYRCSYEFAYAALVPFYFRSAIYSAVCVYEIRVIAKHSWRDQKISLSFYRQRIRSRVARVSSAGIARTKQIELNLGEIRVLSTSCFNVLPISLCSMIRRMNGMFRFAFVCI